MKSKEGCMVRLSLVHLLIVIAVLLFFIGPNQCSCSQKVAEKVVEWQIYVDSIRTNCENR